MSFSDDRYLLVDSRLWRCGPDIASGGTSDPFTLEGIRDGSTGLRAIGEA